MPLPNDPLSRWWAEAAEQNPTVADGFRQCLLALLAFGPSREPSLVGSAFVIGHGDGCALALTARHVLPAGVYSSQHPSARHAASALFVPASSSKPSLDPNKLKALWMGPRTAEALNLAHVSYNDSLDISSFLVVPQEGREPFRPAMIPLDTTVPAVGDVVHMVSNDQLDVEETRPPIDYDGKGHEIKIERRVSIRVGVVTGVYQAGYRQFRWPCFTTSIPARPGMSGGFVFVPRDQQIIAACGVVSADLSDPVAHSSFMACGESVIASTWSSLCLSVPVVMSRGITDPPTTTLLEAMRVGRLGTAIGGIHDIAIVPTEEGGVQIRNRLVRVA